eukprot:scaffold108127_cov43-Attheya_sp.AAC.1
MGVDAQKLQCDILTPSHALHHSSLTIYSDTTSSHVSQKRSNILDFSSKNNPCCKRHNKDSLEQKRDARFGRGGQWVYYYHWRMARNQTAGGPRYSCIGCEWRSNKSVLVVSTCSQGHSARFLQYAQCRLCPYTTRGLCLWRGTGREHLNDLHVLHVDTYEWRKVETTGEAPQ